MRIESNRPIRPTGRRDEKKGGVSGESFAESLNSEPAAQPATSAPSLGALSGLLSLQEVPDATQEARRRGTARGDALLDGLEELRIGLLAGRVSRDKLADMARLVRQARPSVDDPRLTELLDEIELRVAVELAKLTLVA